MQKGNLNQIQFEVPDFLIETHLINTQSTSHIHKILFWKMCYFFSAKYDLLLSKIWVHCCRSSPGGCSIHIMQLPKTLHLSQIQDVKAGYKGRTSRLVQISVTEIGWLIKTQWEEISKGWWLQIGVPIMSHEIQGLTYRRMAQIELKTTLRSCPLL